MIRATLFSLILTPTVWKNSRFDVNLFIPLRISIVLSRNKKGRKNKKVKKHEQKQPIGN